MQSIITIENFRCFGEKQTARLAPLTLLVGENSTGKTSFLALLRALDDLAHNDIPDFKKPPYDLGSFDEIAHYREGKSGRAEIFSAEIVTSSVSAPRQGKWKLAVRFRKDTNGTAPMPVNYCTFLGGTSEENDDTWIEINCESSSIKVGTKQGAWNISKYDNLQRGSMPSLSGILLNLISAETPSALKKLCNPEEDSPQVTEKDRKAWQLLRDEILTVRRAPHAFAGAAVRAQPRRTYDPASSVVDPEGNYVAMHRASLSLQKKSKVWTSLKWTSLKQRLEKFGQSSGLFDEIRIRHLGKDNDPFQVQVRKSRQRGVWHDLTDVGHGVSQVLPIIIELLGLDNDAKRESSKNSHPRQFLLQQPEVHLHPSAQAALGSLFCQITGPQRRLIVETHSDHLMDRVRMDVRDGVSNLKPEDVSILFFEHCELDVRIHSLGLDQQGNILGAPDGYRQFFMNEMTRSVWPKRSSEHGKVEA